MLRYLKLKISFSCNFLLICHCAHSRQKREINTTMIMKCHEKFVTYISGERSCGVESTSPFLIDDAHKIVNFPNDVENVWHIKEDDEINVCLGEMWLNNDCDFPSRKTENCVEKSRMKLCCDNELGNLQFSLFWKGGKVFIFEELNFETIINDNDVSVLWSHKLCVGIETETLTHNCELIKLILR